MSARCLRGEMSAQRVPRVTVTATVRDTERLAGQPPPGLQLLRTREKFCAMQATGLTQSMLGDRLRREAGWTPRRGRAAAARPLARPPAACRRRGRLGAGRTLLRRPPHPRVLRGVEVARPEHGGFKERAEVWAECVGSGGGWQRWRRRQRPVLPVSLPPPPAASASRSPPAPTSCWCRPPGSPSRCARALRSAGTPAPCCGGSRAAASSAPQRHPSPPSAPRWAPAATARCRR